MNRIVPLKFFISDLLPTFRKKTIAWTNGCFDLLHAGHKDILRKSQSFCDILVVGLNNDESIKALKGPTRPFESFYCRAQKILDIVSYSYIIETEVDPTGVIEAIIPDVIVKGEDYRKSWVAGASIVRKAQGVIRYVNFYHDTSTTKKAKSLGLE